MQLRGRESWNQIDEWSPWISCANHREQRRKTNQRAPPWRGRHKQSHLHRAASRSWTCSRWSKHLHRCSRRRRKHSIQKMCSPSLVQSELSSRMHIDLTAVSNFPPLNQEMTKSDFRSEIWNSWIHEKRSFVIWTEFHIWVSRVLINNYILKRQLQIN